MICMRTLCTILGTTAERMKTTIIHGASSDNTIKCSTSCRGDVQRPYISLEKRAALGAIRLDTRMLPTPSGCGAAR